MIQNVELFLMYLPHVLVWIVITALVSWVFIQVPGRYVLKYALWPALLAGTMYTSILYADSLGRPIPSTLPDVFVFQGYRALGVGTKSARLEVWTVERGKSRLYVIPYSTSRQASLEKGQEALKKGDTVTMRRNKTNRNKNGEDATEDKFDSELTQHGGLPPKQ